MKKNIIQNVSIFLSIGSLMVASSALYFSYRDFKWSSQEIIKVEVTRPLNGLYESWFEAPIEDTKYPPLIFVQWDCRVINVSNCPVHLADFIFKFNHPEQLESKIKQYIESQIMVIPNLSIISEEPLAPQFPLEFSLFIPMILDYTAYKLLEEEGYKTGSENKYPFDQLSNHLQKYKLDFQGNRLDFSIDSPPTPQKKVDQLNYIKFTTARKNHFEYKFSWYKPIHLE